ncbi:PilN domain-containing protein [Thauera propionica]|jgi:general secretion pathway protein L|uniref:PilN domain-containing protein n=1 Tax=Thauera propionica TaxID=2019431 RepID=UPI0023F4DD13|nr:PilN domain-containing protein [Thauera propionica]MDD3676586.1 PilN domain-containing protein [Thauera propionica]
MALEVGNLSLFGLDLRSLGRVWRNGWDEALRWPLLGWLSPSESIRVLLPDGSEALRAGVSALPVRPASTAQAVALVLPDDTVLVRELTLPRLRLEELRQALALEVGATSPFPVDETVWGWTDAPAGTQTRVRLAMAARSHVAAVLASAGARLAGADPEVWAAVEAPIVLQGYAEGRRLARLRRARRAILAALLGCVVLAVALAAVPVWQARARVFDAQIQYGQLESQVADLVAARSALTTGNDRLRALKAHFAERQYVPQLIETLTLTLPDDAFLTRLEVQGRKVQIVGQADNASQLMSALGVAGSPFRDVRAPSPISRAAASGKENFVIEFVVADEERQQ